VAAQHGHGRVERDARGDPVPVSDVEQRTAPSGDAGLHFGIIRSRRQRLRADGLHPLVSARQRVTRSEMHERHR
jgi:hypothetical protein